MRVWVYVCTYSFVCYKQLNLFIRTNSTRLQGSHVELWSNMACALIFTARTEIRMMSRFIHEFVLTGNSKMANVDRRCTISQNETTYVWQTLNARNSEQNAMCDGQEMDRVRPLNSIESICQLVFGRRRVSLRNYCGAINRWIRRCYNSLCRANSIT